MREAHIGWARVSVKGRSALQNRETFPQWKVSQARVGRSMELRTSPGPVGTETIIANSPRMNTYFALVTFTQQGLQNIHESPHRATAFKSAAKKAGVKVRDLYWTLGAYDGVIVFDAQSDEAATSVMLSLAALGNVRTQTLRAFDASEFAAIAAKATKM
jgi:uncharacterized protein with GYD domain